MIIYNITINIDEEVHDEWMEWMCKIHIPDVMDTGYFIEYRLSKILAEEQGGLTYSIQYIAPDMDSYKAYQEKDAERLQKEHSSKYEGRFVAFRTLLHLIQKDGQA